MKKIFKNQWCVIHPDGNPWLFTLSHTRAESLQKFLDEDIMTWAECKKIGWTVVKTTLTLEW